VATEPKASRLDEPALLRDLYHEFAERRRTSPVWPESVAPGTGDGVTLYRYEDCARVLRDPATFSSRAYEQNINLVMGRTILSMDEPDHKWHRDLVAHAFLQKTLASWADGVISAICNELVDHFQPSGRADLVAEFCGEVPIRVTARILGLPPEDGAEFQRWGEDLLNIVEDVERGFAASLALRDYFAAILQERRHAPQEDMISDLARAEIDGRRLDDEDIYSFLRLLLPAGVETTAHALPTLLWRLLGHPDQLQAVVSDRSLVPRAIEESLRLDVPVLYIARMAAVDTEIGGTPVPAGSYITLCLGSANRDESRWADPDRFDVGRPPQQHLAFAAGPHMCLGQQLARMEIAVAVGVLFDRLPNLRLDREAKPPSVIAGSGGSLPSLDSLPVRFDVA